MESVDCWPMAITVQKTFGGKPKPVAAYGVTGGRYPPPERRMPYAVNARCAAAAVFADRLLGNSVGAIGWPLGTCCSPCSRDLGVEGTLWRPSYLVKLLCPY